MLAAQRAGIGAGEGDIAVGQLFDLVKRLVKVDRGALGLRKRRAVRQLIRRGAGGSSHCQTKSQGHDEAKDLLHRTSSFF